MGRRQNVAQRGFSTLAMALLLLGFVTLIAVLATRTALQDLAATTVENRARLAEQAAEYGLNLGGEYLKSQLPLLVSGDAGGWLAPDARRWVPCAGATLAPGHPCLAESDPVRRAAMYFTVLADDADDDERNDSAHLVPQGRLASVGGSAQFPVQLRLAALLCRVDVSDPAAPACALDPARGNDLAVTLLATGALAGEGARATLQETWATHAPFVPAPAAPLSLAGTLRGQGRVQVVTAPDAGGPGVALAAWSPQDLPGQRIEACTMQDFLHPGRLVGHDVLAVCSVPGKACGCVESTPAASESPVIADRDGGLGARADIATFPGAGFDRADDPADDNLFEWIFEVDYVAEQAGCDEDNAGGCAEDPGAGHVAQDCGVTGEENCARFALREALEFVPITCAHLQRLGAQARGNWFIARDWAQPDTTCVLGGELGSPRHGVAIVAEDRLVLDGITLHGTVFVRSDTQSATLETRGRARVFGAAVVEGDLDAAGALDIVYRDWAGLAAAGKQPPPARQFGRVAGSWVDAGDGL